jgi:N-acetylmuramic acid 6-phosphate etherase
MTARTPHPPDRSGILTEQRNPRSADLHRLSVADCVSLMAREDRAVLDALDRAAPALTAFIEAVLPRFAAGGRLIYLGAGTSGRLGVLDASEAPPTFQIEPGRIIGIIAGGDASLRRSSEGKEDDPRGAVPDLAALELTPNDTILGIAAGGTTPYVLGGLEYARSCVQSRATGGSSTSAPLSATGGLSTSANPQAALSPGITGGQAASGTQFPLTALLTCSPIPPRPSIDHLILLDTGPEVLTGSTRLKAGTATKLALNTISTTLMVQTGRVYQNLMVDLRATNDKLRDRAARIVAELTGLPRDASLTLLDRAGGWAKAAIVMHRLGIDRTEAERRLAEVGGRLGDLIGDQCAPHPHRALES